MNPRPYVLKPYLDPLPIEFQNELNEEQLQVVTAPSGPALVLAGAGSGKTRTLVYRVAYLLKKGIPKDAILLVTFTNRAAREMLDRVSRLIGGTLSGFWGGTFHHIANRLLRRYAPLLHYPNNFTILDREDSKFLLQDLASEFAFRTREVRFPKGDVLQDIASYAINCAKGIEEVLHDRYPYYLSLAEEISKILEKYEARKKSAGLMDFDDLLFNWHKLLIDFPYVQEEMSTQFQHILVDEYQDTNRLQGEILAKLASGKNSIMVVGDDAQSIYSFRGAVFQNILDFPTHHPGTKIYKLETNYRSTPEILNLANAILEQNKNRFEKKLKSIRSNGLLPVLAPAGNPEEQASFIAQRILELRDSGFEFSQMAVLYRAHYQSAEIELEFMRRNIPYEIRSGLRFFEQAHIKDVLAYLRLLENPKDELSWKRVFKTLDGIGAKTSSLLWETMQKEEDPFSALEIAVSSGKVRRAKNQIERLCALFKKLNTIKENVSQALTETTEFYDDYLKSTFPNYRERKIDLEELAHFALRYETLQSFLSDVAMQEGISGEDILLPDEKEEGVVVLSTIHRAKGLEWGVVFIPWLLEGHFPLSYTHGDSEAIEEERRLFYVAATRAKNELYLLYPRFTHEQKVIHKPSPFLQEMPTHLYEVWEIVPS
jgi:DNA helicase-2/ATP-dependent DNA helicase PcrA